jgi:hypothetical protein
MQGAGVMSVALAVSAAGTVVVVRLLRRRAKNRDEIVTGVLGPSVGALHMLIVAFALVAGWQTVSDADSTASDEARRTVELYWSARSLPGPVGQDVVADVRQYVRVSVQTEWPQMRHGRLGDDSALLLDQARLRLLRMRTKEFTIEERRLDTLDRLRDLSAVHDHRASLAGTRLPPLLLIGVVVTSLLMIVFPLLMGIDGTLHSLAWAVTASVLFTATVLVVLAFARPYDGAMGIGPGAFQSAQQQFARIDTYPPSTPPPGRSRK